RQALVDEARKRRAAKRDGGTPVTLSDEHLGAAHDAGFDALEVDALLTELGTFDKVAAEIVTLRVFGGLSIEEVADVLCLSVRTTHRRWDTGKAWLAHELGPKT